MERKLLKFSRTTSQSASRYALLFLNNKCSNHEKTNFRRYRTIGHSGLLVKESRLKECACLGDIQVTFIFKEKETEN